MFISLQDDDAAEPRSKNGSESFDAKHFVTEHILSIFDKTGADGWLNDDIINGYYSMLHREQLRGSLSRKTVFASSFLAEKAVFDTLHDYEPVYPLCPGHFYRTQLSLNSLSDFDYMLCPVNYKKSHWALVIVDLKRRVLRYLDSSEMPQAKVDRVLLGLRMFIVDHYKKFNVVTNIYDWKFEVVQKLPKQSNWWDCGVFVLAYTNYFAYRSTNPLSWGFNQRQCQSYRQQFKQQLTSLEARPLQEVNTLYVTSYVSLPS